MSIKYDFDRNLAAKHYHELFIQLMNKGMGEEVGPEDANINELADEIGGTLELAATNDNEVAVYSLPDGRLALVGDVHGPWMITVSGDE